MNTSPAPNTSSPTSSAASREIREKVFGPLLDIRDESIISLALKVRNQVSSEPYEPSPNLKPQVLSHLHGSYNLVFIVDIVLSHLPKSSHDPFSEDDPETATETENETFVLCHPDFNSQNILIDEKGNLTGLIDWDDVQTYPRFLGYCRYPSFLTPDWDPLMYGYPGCPRYLSPEELVRYRQIYSDKMIQMLDREGNAIFAEKSHLYEAVWIASCDRMNRMEIMKKIIKQAVPDISLEYNEFDLLLHLAQDELAPDLMGKFEKGIKKLLAVARPERNKVARL
ncbi:hypothetical protein MMC14_010619 [Varicellaria rhodocarpa]|nr:hypothetical protein [Varicellaria rhodocarpa]